MLTPCPRMLSLNVAIAGIEHTTLEGGDRVVVPWYQRGGTWYNIVEMWWNLVPKVGATVRSLYESVPIKISSLDDFGIPRTNF